jgi:hypothetical protein
LAGCTQPNLAGAISKSGSLRLWPECSICGQLAISQAHVGSQDLGPAVRRDSRVSRLASLARKRWLVGVRGFEPPAPASRTPFTARDNWEIGPIPALAPVWNRELTSNIHRTLGKMNLRALCAGQPSALAARRRWDGLNLAYTRSVILLSVWPRY